MHVCNLSIARGGGSPLPGETEVSVPCLFRINPRVKTPRFDEFFRVIPKKDWFAHANEMPVELQMGPHALMTDTTVRENIMTGLNFLGCKSCGTYDRHNQVAQVALAYLRHELKFTGLLNQLSRQQLCGHFCGRQEQAHRRTGLGEPLLAETTGHRCERTK